MVSKLTGVCPYYERTKVELENHLEAVFKGEN